MTETTGAAQGPELPGQSPVDVLGDAAELAHGETSVTPDRVAGPPGGAAALASLTFGFVAILGGGYVTFLLQWVASKFQEHLADADLAQRVNDVANASGGLVPAGLALGLGLYARSRAGTPWVSAAGTAGALVATYSLVVTALSIAITFTQTSDLSGLY